MGNGLLNERVDHLREHKVVKSVLAAQLVLQDFADYHNSVVELQHHVKTIGIASEIRCDLVDSAEKLPLQPIGREDGARGFLDFLPGEGDSEGIAGY